MPIDSNVFSPMPIFLRLYNKLHLLTHNHRLNQVYILK